MGWHFYKTYELLRHSLQPSLHHLFNVDSHLMAALGRYHMVINQAAPVAAAACHTF
jgi:hypothetical protein